MGSDLAETEESELAEHEESAKRRQIMEGAREVFLAQGFDAASMGEIARKAGVSKGTLYVYFDSLDRGANREIRGGYQGGVTARQR